MGKLIKNHWARLIILTAASCTSTFDEASERSLVFVTHSPARVEPDPLTNHGVADQVAAAVEAFFWPKIFFDFLTKTLDPAVKPFPVLQVLNLVFGIIMLLWEWPLGLLAGSSLHRSLEARLAALPLVALAAALLYQGTNAAIYYLIGMVVYFWAYSEAEVRTHSRNRLRWLGDRVRVANSPSRSSVPSRGPCRKDCLGQPP